MCETQRRSFNLVRRTVDSPFEAVSTKEQMDEPLIVHQVSFSVFGWVCVIKGPCVVDHPLAVGRARPLPRVSSGAFVHLRCCRGEQSLWHLQRSFRPNCWTSCRSSKHVGSVGQKRRIM